MGTIIGAGIFVVTGVAAGVAGPSFLIGLLLAGIAATFNALSSAQLAATYPQSGGTYEYGYRVLHPLLGFAAGWMFLVSKLAAGGIVALGFAGYLNALVPGIPERPAAVGAIMILTAVNYFGIKKSGKLNTTIVAITVLVLLLFIIAGVSSIKSSNLIPFAPSGITGILKSAALLFFAYTGYARLATLGEEVHDPKKTIPYAIILALGLSAILYAGVAIVAVGTIGAGAMSRTSSPIKAAAATLTMPGVGIAVSIAATTAMLGVLLSQILGISRMFFAMGRRGDLPSFFNHIHPVNKIPDRSIFITGFSLLLVALFGTLQLIVAAATFTILLYYSITNLAAFKMKSTDKLFHDWIPIAGLISCLVLAFSLSLQTIITGIILLAGGFIVRWIVNLTFRKNS
jgi:APA family basic amino acid/polyamine antiporter